MQRRGEYSAGSVILRPIQASGIHMKEHILLLLSGVFFLFFFAAANAVIAAPDTLRVAFSESPPAKIFDGSGKPIGIDTEFVEELARRLGLHVKYDIVPFKRGLLMLKQGSSDLMSGVLKGEDREEYLYFIQPAYRHRSDKVFYVRKGDEDLIRSHNDLHKITVATLLGVKYYPAFDSDEKINKLLLSNPEVVFNMLAAGRVDAVVSWELSGDYRVAQHGLTDQIGKAKYAFREEQDVFLALSKNSLLVPMLPQIEAEMNKMLDEGVYEQIIDKYLHPQPLKK